MSSSFMISDFLSLKYFACAYIEEKSSTTTTLFFVKNKRSIPLHKSPTNSSNVISPCKRGDTSDDAVEEPVPEDPEDPDEL